MSSLTVKSGKGELHLHKSKTLAGLKVTADTNLADQDYVQEDLLQNLGGFHVVALETHAGALDEALDEVRTHEEVEVGTHVYFAQGSNKPIIPTGEIYIIFQDGVSEAEQKMVLEEYRLEMVERRTPTQIIARVTPRSSNPLKVAQSLQGISLVKTAEPDLDIPLEEYDFASPTDDLFAHQWHLQNSGLVADVNYRLQKGADAKVADAWRRLGNLGNPNVTIAIIDNGFDTSHPDLKNQIVKPFDLWNQSSRLTEGDARYTHGTPCASVALAASNGQGIVGVAPNARFMPVSGTSFSLRATEQMFDYCVQNGADIISCSWGTTDSAYSLNTMKEAAIAKAAREGRNGKGCVILFATGNDDLNYVNFYAAHPDVIAVGASNSQDQYAFYSNRGREVSVCAPSNGDWPIIAARAWWDAGIANETGTYKYWRDGRNRSQYYKHFGGTSSSTPLVAGICALMLSANPALTAKEVKDILQQTADKIGNPNEYTNGHSIKYGYGRVNADKAVAEALRRRDRQDAPVTTAVATRVTKGQGLFQFDVKRQEPVGFGVQIGAFYEYGNVLIQAEKLQRQFGQPIIVSINELNGKTVYKIAVGRFGTSSEASELAARMKSAGVNGFTRSFKDL